VDGDMVDDKEWCEGPFRQDMSVRKLFMTKNKRTRPVRRRLNGRENNPIDESSSTDEEDSCSSFTSSSLTSSSDDESTEDEKGSWLPVQALLGTASTVAVPAVFVSIFKGEGDFS
jgi:hypothetical protein